MRGEERLCRAQQAPNLLLADHLQRIAEVKTAFGLHLAEDDTAAAPRDQVDLHAAEACVRRQHAEAAPEGVQPRSPPGSSTAAGRRLLRALLQGAGSRAPGTRGGASSRDHARARSRSARE